MKILIVDDEFEILESFSEMLEDHGHQVFQCMNPVDSLKVLRENRIDCVVTDLKMPEIRGQYLIEILRAGYPEIPVIVLSGNVESEEDLKKLGASKIFSKPVEAEDILQGIRDAVSEN